jgi:alkylresorcinol/alkylpyrone synthase
MSKIAATAVAFPPHYYTHAQILEAMRQVWSERPNSLSRLDAFYQNTQVEGRHLALPLESYLESSSFGERNTAWITAALDLGEQVLCSVFDQARLALEKASLLAFTTVTGIAVPSIDARLMNRLPFSPHLKRLPLFGLGCLGGAAGIARVADYLRGHPDQAALLLSIEFCSLTIQHDDLSVANMVSSGLFGDGSAAVLLVGNDHPLAASAAGPRVLDTCSVFFPETEHIMGWEVSETGFKVILSPDVAPVAQEQLRPALEPFLAQHGLALADIACWVAHPGGPKVMQALEKGLDLPPDALDLSRQCLAQNGNLSSASVLAVLDRTLAERRPAPGSYGLLLAMGPAFSAEAVLLQW